MQRVKRWKEELVECEEIGIGGMKNVTFMIDGQGAYSMMKYESGVHRVQRVPGDRKWRTYPHINNHSSSYAGGRRCGCSYR